MTVGSAFRTAARTITETDLITFITWSGFNEALFLDASHAAAGGYTGRLVPGALVYCLGEGLVIQTNVINGTGLAFMSMDLSIKQPAYVGDTIHVVVEVTQARAASTGQRGVVTTRNSVRNQRGEDLLIYTPVRLIRGRGYQAPGEARLDKINYLTDSRRHETFPNEPVAGLAAQVTGASAPAAAALLLVPLLARRPRPGPSGRGPGPSNPWRTSCAGSRTSQRTSPARCDRPGNGPAGGSTRSAPPPLMTVIEGCAAGSVAIPTDCGPPPLSAVSA